MWPNLYLCGENITLSSESPPILPRTSGKSSPHSIHWVKPSNKRGNGNATDHFSTTSRNGGSRPRIVISHDNYHSRVSTCSRLCQPGVSNVVSQTGWCPLLCLYVSLGHGLTIYLSLDNPAHCVRLQMLDVSRTKAIQPAKTLSKRLIAQCSKIFARGFTLIMPDSLVAQRSDNRNGAQPPLPQGARGLFITQRVTAN
jgi:hypothetical protein